jgi:hypothetical protein
MIPLATLLLSSRPFSAVSTVAFDMRCLRGAGQGITVARVVGDALGSSGVYERHGQVGREGVGDRPGRILVSQQPGSSGVVVGRLTGGAARRGSA